MQKKENQQELWKTVVYCILCTFGMYLVLQCFNALLIAKELVGEDRAVVLVWVSAGVSTLAGILVMGRNWRTKRLILGALCVLGFVAALLLCALAAGGEFSVMGGRLAGTAGASLAGGLLASVAVGPKKGRKTRKRH